MEIKQIGVSQKNFFNKFIAENNGSFLQSFEWGEFQKATGRKIWRLAVEEKEEILAAATLLSYPLPFKKSYLYCPRGSVIKVKAGQKTTAEIFKLFLEETGKIAKKTNAVFFKIEPDLNFNLNLPDFGFKKSGKEIQPSETIILDLRKNEEELLKEMKPKTRYNIKVAEKHGIKIDGSAAVSEIIRFADFWKLLKETASRDKFGLHSENYYETMLKNPDLEARCPSENKLFIAENPPAGEGKIIAGAIVNFFGRRATYLHGASSGEHKNLMAPYLLHWEIAKYAKNNGFEEYDFWGISEKKYPGVTRFKRGFGGKEIKYAGAYDFIFDKFWHLMYLIGRKVI